MYIVKEYFKDKTDKWEKDEFVGVSFYEDVEHAIKAYLLIELHQPHEYPKLFELDYDENGEIYEDELCIKEIITHLDRLRGKK